MGHAPLYALSAPPEVQNRYQPRAGLRIPRDPPWLTPPEGALNFKGQQFTTAAGPGPASNTSLAQVQVSQDMVAVIRELSYAVNSVTTASRITFTLRFNQSPVEGFDFQVFPKVAATDMQLFDPPTTVIHVPAGAMIDVNVLVTDANAYIAGVYFRGWQYPLELLEAWRNAQG